MPLVEALVDLLGGSADGGGNSGGGSGRLAGQALMLRSWLDGLAGVSQVRRFWRNAPRMHHVFYARGVAR